MCTFLFVISICEIVKIQTVLKAKAYTSTVLSLGLDLGPEVFGLGLRLIRPWLGLGLESCELDSRVCSLNTHQLFFVWDILEVYA